MLCYQATIHFHPFFGTFRITDNRSVKSPMQTKSYFIKRLILLIFSLSLLLTGCTYRMAFGGCAYRVKTGECQRKEVPDADIMAASYTAADKLLRNATHLLRPDYQILVTSLADIDNLEDTTSLGRLIGEQLSARFAQQGYTVVEAKLHSDLIKIPRTGELVLSREAREMGQAQNAAIIVAGTYAVGNNKVYVTLKMLNSYNSEVMSSYAYSLPIGPNTSTLLKKSFWWW